LKRGTKDVVLFGFNVNPQHKASPEPKLTGFSFIFNNPYTTASATTFENFRVFESTNGSFTGAVNNFLPAEVTEGQSPILPIGTPTATKDMVSVTITDPLRYRDLSGTETRTYYLVADVNNLVNNSTPNIRVQLIDGGYGSTTNNGITITQGSTAVDGDLTTATLDPITGKEYTFASTRPPSLISSYPENGQLNVDSLQQTITLTFDVGVWSLDGQAKLYDRQNNKLIATLDAINGRYSQGDPVAGSITNPTPLTFQIPSGVKLKPDSVYYLTIDKGTFDPVNNTGKGISDDGYNLFGGISYNGTLYFKIGSKVAPKMKETEPLRYYVSTTGGSINAAFDQFGKAYFAIVNQNATPPTINQIKDPASGYPALARDTIEIDQVYPNVQFGTFEANLSAGTYEVWMYAENDALPNPVPTVHPYGPKNISTPTSSYLETPGAVGNPTFRITVPANPGVLTVNNPTYNVCSNSTTTLADPIIISEGTSAQFLTGVRQDFNILLPTGFEFASGSLPEVTMLGNDFAPGDLSNPNRGKWEVELLSGSVLNISFINTGVATLDKIIISNLRLKANAGASGQIRRFAGNAIPALPNNTKLAGIGAVAAPALTFTNTYSTKTNFSAIGIVGDVATIPDNFVDVDGLAAVRLVPDIPTGDYGPSFFSGSGVTNDVLSLTGVALNSAFDITFSHTDMNGCVSTQTAQYEVYDHLNAIPKLIDPVYGTSTSIENPNYKLGTPAPSLLDVTKIIAINSRAGYNLRELYANIPTTAKPMGLDSTANQSGEQIIYGPAWESLVNQIPIINSSSTLGRSYNWDYSVLLPLNPSLDPYKYFNEVTPNGNRYYKGGSLGKIEFTGRFQSTADGNIQVPIRQQIELFVPAIPVVEVSGEITSVAATSIFCEKGNQIIINGYPAASAGSSTGVFTIYEAGNHANVLHLPGATTAGFTDNGNGSAVLNPALFTGHNNNDIEIVYTFKDNNAPKSGSGSKIIRITQNPIADFTIISKRADDPLILSGCEGTPVDFDGTNSTGSISTYSWNFNDALNSTGVNPNVETGDAASAQQVDHSFTQSGRYNVSLVVTSAFGCPSDPGTKTIDIGAYPDIQFGFMGTSIADAITFNTTGSTLPSAGAVNDSFMNFYWKFGDGNQKVNGVSAESHDYSTPGSYDVFLEITSRLGCKDTLMKPIIILGQRTPTSAAPYSEDFENATIIDWQPASIPATLTTDPRTYTWEVGTPTGITITAAINGSRVWKTNIEGPFNPLEQSALYSPSFDLSGLTRPMISFYSHSDIPSSDGVVLQYSVDNLNVADPNKVWHTVGEENEGVFWFNAQAITSKPGDQPRLDLGWNGSFDWREAKHAIVDELNANPPKDPIVGETNVVFRFAFASAKESGVIEQGFAVDNFRVGNSTRTVLLENFSNTAMTSSLAIDHNQTFRDFNNNQTETEIVKIDYHVAFPGTDPFNATNPADPGARALYYGVSTLPQARLDGSAYSTPSTDFSDWGPFNFGQRILELANAQINISPATVADGEMTFTVDFTPYQDLMQGRTILHVAVVEDSIPVNINSSLGPIGSNESQFRYVLKKMLPNAAGTIFTNLSRNVSSGPLEFTWSPGKLYAPNDDIAIVAFLQDEMSRKVYQAEIRRSVTDPELVTGIEDISISFKVYPSPADQELNIELPQAFSEQSQLQMFDQLGKVVTQSTFEKGQKNKTINTSDLTGGVYLIQINTVKGILRRKVMVMHNH
jgi:hypothetical protein